MLESNHYPPRDRAEFICDAVGNLLSVRVRGEIDHHTAQVIRKGIDGALFEYRPKKLILDLSAVSFMDSSGLGLIMGRYSVIRELGGDMTVWNPSRETRVILQLAGMERLVKIEYPEGEAPTPPEAAKPRASSGTTRRRQTRRATPKAGLAARKEKEA